MFKQMFPTFALSAAAAVAFVAAPAHAGSVYGLHGNGGLKKSHILNYSDVDITATASAWDPKKDVVHGAHVGQYRHGLGVTNSVYYKNTWWGGKQLKTNDGSHTVDGKGYDDTVWLSFSKDFKLHGATFTYVGSKHEDVKVVNEYGQTLGRYDLSEIASNGVAHLNLHGLGFKGDKIGFTAYGDKDSWKLKSVKGHAVPTPSAAAAGLLGLAALVARRRRETADQA
ncbi:MAG: MYXO-CTERM sorting domain-containing protein [Planctomycetota bacterium]